MFPVSIIWDCFPFSAMARTRNAMFVKIISLLLIFSFAGGAIAATEQQAHNVKRVLVVDSYASSDLWTERLNQGIHEILNEKNCSSIMTVTSSASDTSRESNRHRRISKPSSSSWITRITIWSSPITTLRQTSF